MDEQPARNTTVLYELWRASRRATALMEEALEQERLNGSEFALYSLLRFSGPMTPSEVARRTATATTTTSEALKRMEDRGHIQRTPNPTDARSVTVELTVEGEAAHAATAGAFQPLLQAINADLGSEVDQVIYSLARLDRAMAVVAGDERDDLSPMPARPTTSSTHTLTYAGAPLTIAEEDEVRRFAEWLRFRRSAE